MPSIILSNASFKSFLAILTTVNAGDLKTIKSFPLTFNSKSFLSSVDGCGKNIGSVYLLNCHLYKYLLFLFDLKDIKDHLEFQQLLHSETLKN